MKTLLKLLMEWQRREPLLLVTALSLVVGYGIMTAIDSEIVAFPELTNVQVQVITQFPGKASEEVERKITMPIEIATNGLPGLINQRSISLFGLSVVTLTFDDAVNSKIARIDTAQRLNDVGDLPEGIKPSLSPDTTPLGEIYRYTIEGSRPSDEIRLIEDWKLEREFKSIPGVADVVTFGGPIRTVEAKLDIDRLKAFGFTVAGVAQALQQNHANAGGATITHGEEAYVVRSLGLFENPRLLESAVVGASKGTPVRLRDIGTVTFGTKIRMGQVGIGKDDDRVEGLVLLRNGANTIETCRLIREHIAKLNSGGLPEGLKIRTMYDRTSLIEKSSHTVAHNIIFGILLVCIVLTLSFGLKAWRFSLAVALVIPFSLLIVFIGLRAAGYPPNLISLGAVDFGIIIETAIFSAEAVLAAMLANRATIAMKQDQIIQESMAEILRPALLCALILFVGFIPILALERVEGRIFRPLGITLVSALVGGQLGAILFLPIAARLTRKDIQASWLEHYIIEKMPRFIRIADFLRARKTRAWGLFSVVTLVTLFLAFTAGREFLPAFNEGSLFVRAFAPMNSSRESSVKLAKTMRERLMKLPEVTNFITQVGRPDDGTDVNGFDVIEGIIALKDQDEWVTAKSIDGLAFEAQKRLSDLEGVEFAFSQPIKDNVDEAISGVKGDLVVKIFGPKITEIQRIAKETAKVLRTVRGAKEVVTEQLLGQPELRFTMDKDAIGRSGIRVTDVEDALEMALLGRKAGRLIDDQSREIDIVVRPRLMEPITADQLDAVPILTPEGARLKMSDVTSPTLLEGVTRIFHEQGERRTAVKMGVENRAVVDFVTEASSKLAASVKLPPGYRFEWAGSFASASRAGKQLLILVPLCLAGIIILLYSWFHNIRAVGLVLCEIPMALIGGFTLLRAFSLNLSVSAAVGAIVLVGVSFLGGLMLVTNYERARQRGSTEPASVALKEKAFGIILSLSVAIIGLVPATLSTGIGSETAKPFAVMILGGLCSSLVLTLTLLPALMGQATQSNHEPEELR